MKVTLKIFLLSCCLLVCASTLAAKSWRGITPLKSTKTDVERLLGKPSEATDKLLSYRLTAEIVFITLVTGDLEEQALPMGTVKYIEVRPKHSMQLAELGLDEKKVVRIKGSLPEYAGFWGYVDEDAGLIVQYGREVETIFYFANVEDRAVCPTCKVNVQSLADIPICILCPTVSVSCPDETYASGKATFTANFTVSSPAAKETYNWTVDAGTIVEGQGTNSITVDVSNVKGRSITATVEVGGIDPACNRTASCTTQIAKRSPR
jgi:PKD-like domain